MCVGVAFAEVAAMLEKEILWVLRTSYLGTFILTLRLVVRVSRFHGLCNWDWKLNVIIFEEGYTVAVTHSPPFFIHLTVCVLLEAQLLFEQVYSDYHHCDPAFH